MSIFIGGKNIQFMNLIWSIPT